MVEILVERVLPRQMESVITARIKIMANLDITEHRIPQDGRIKLNLVFPPVDIRVFILHVMVWGKSIMRLTLNDINKLGFNTLNLKDFTINYAI